MDSHERMEVGSMNETFRFDRAVLVPFAAIVLAMLPAVLDQTILATALPVIATDLGRLTDVAWVATVVGPLTGGGLVDHAGWRWVFLVNLPLGALALAGLAWRLPATPVDGDRAPLDVPGAALLAGATSTFMLVCIWGGERYAWTS